MTSEEPQYELTEIKAIRGGEAKAIESKQQEGWELVSQEQGRLRSTLVFRRPKPKTPWRLWAALGGMAVVLLAIALLMGVMGEEDSNESNNEADSASSSAVAIPQPEEEPLAPEPVEIITVENNADFAQLLQVRDYCSETVSDFASKYAGRTIAFDGYIGALNNHDDYKTRYDILINEGDYDESSFSGPEFQFRDVNIVSDLNLTGPNIPDTLAVKDALRITAEVKEYEEKSCLFLLEPVTTEFR